MKPIGQPQPSDDQSNADELVDLALIEAVDRSNQPAIILDSQHRVHHVNEAYLRNLARPIETVRGAYVNVATASPIVDVDPLTGLCTREELVRVLGHELQEADGKRAIAVLTVELGGLKRVNDGLGRSLGDVLIRAAAQRLIASTPMPAIVARVGGTEFAMVYSGVRGATETVNLAERLCARLAEPFEVSVDNSNSTTPIHVQSSVGIALSASEGADAEDLLRNADAALAHVRLNESRAWEIFQPHMRSENENSFASENALRQALENDELRVFYQPEVSFDNQKPLGAEALLRWEHPEKGLVSAGAFVGLAEDTGLVVPIGWWVLGVACQQAVAWHRAGHMLTIRINLSGKQIAHPDLIFQVAKAIQESGIDPAYLCLEITETVLMSDAELALERLSQLKELGLHLAIDDFGTGYSSLSYLKRFPVDVLKIDKSFVDGLATSSLDRSIVSAIIELARAMDLEVTAEGIEDPDQRDVLIDLGCTRGQGFYFHKPLPADQFPLNA